MSEIHRENFDEIEIPENPTFENMGGILAEMETAIQNLSRKEKLFWRKKSSPLFKKLIKIHKFCTEKQNEGRSEWISLRIKCEKIKSSFPVRIFRQYLELVRT